MKPKLSITVHGIGDVQRRLDGLAARALDARPAADSIGRPLVSDMQDQIDQQGLVRTGAMRRSVRVVDADPDRIRVGPTVP